MATLYSGTSGFAYPSWKPGFYPEGLPQSRFLEYYAGRLTTVEINYTFRRLPSSTTLEKWVRATPAGFLFAVKAHRRITHFQRLRDVEGFTATFLAALEPLRAAGRLGPVLFQLPPTFKRDTGRLAEFLDLVYGSTRPDSRAGRWVFELRDVSWFHDDVFGLLREHGAALCITDSETLAVPDEVTADFVYYRLRRADYSDVDILHWAEKARLHLAAGRDAFIMLKHEDDPRGALHAERLSGVL